MRTLKKTLVNAHDTNSLIEKLKQLPPEQVAEVEDFVDFLRTREERSVVRTATRAAEPAVAQVWDNDDDAAYDQL